MKNIRMSVSENNTNIILLRRMRWAGLVALMGRRKIQNFGAETGKTGVDRLVCGRVTP
jgi:hypothetical protein